MRILFLCLFFLHLTGFLSAQKKLIDFSTPATWPYISNQKISNDGKYFLYTLSSQATGSRLIVQSTDLTWKTELKNVNEYYFTEDSRLLIFLTSADSLGIQQLGSDSIRYLADLRSPKMPEDGTGQWLACQNTGPVKALSLINLFNGEEKRFQDVDDYEFNKQGTVLLIQRSMKPDTGSTPSHLLQWIDLMDGKIKTIGKGYTTGNFSFSNSGTKIAFFISHFQPGKVTRKLMYYEAGMDSVKKLVDSATTGMEGKFISEESILFSKKEDKIFFYIAKKPAFIKPDPNDSLADLTIWNSRDDSIQFLKREGSASAVIHLDSPDSIVLLENFGENNSSKPFSNYSGPEENNNDFFIDRTNIIGPVQEYKWRKTATPDTYLVSTRDGSRKLLKKRLITNDILFSPTGKYVIWYDREQKNWFSHRIATGIIKNITRLIPDSLFAEEDHPDLPYSEGIAGWLVADEAIFIYSRYDIWQVDPAGIKPAVNITHGYGRQHRIQLRYLDFNALGSAYDPDKSLPFKKTDTIILSAFSFIDKQSGFYSLTLAPPNALKQLIISPKVYYFPNPYSLRPSLGGVTDVVFPLKAKKAGVYIFNGMSSREYPNLYITRDFQRFSSLTSLAPEKDYNWYTSELIHWKLPDSKSVEGILYKPENFNSKNKYPVIFYYYEKTAYALNYYINPALSNGVINIPWFCSNGYLVFVPDIYYKDGYPGQSACNSVVSAAKYLSKMSWVNPCKLGIQGHSFGGFETNYIVAHCNLFAAAAPSAGSSNLISAYGRFYGDRLQWFYEVKQGRIGTSLWQNPQLYIENSAIFMANKVTTPLLIMHNKGDNTVLFDQETEWFSALSRLGKKAWLLSYGGEEHTIATEKNQMDYSIRLGQFFDHYLKDRPEPKWMKDGKIYNEKGFDYELSPDNRNINNH